MNYRSDNPHTDWPDTMAVTYRSEAFAEDLDGYLADTPEPSSVLERMAAALPLLCVIAPVADAYLRF